MLFDTLLVTALLCLVCVALQGGLLSVAGWQRAVAVAILQQ